MLRRIIGTRITLIGETINTTCGTIESVHEDLSTAYTVTCPPTTEMTLKILLRDETSLDGDLTEYSGRTVMHLAEVTAFGTESGTQIGTYYPVL